MNTQILGGTQRDRFAGCLEHRSETEKALFEHIEAMLREREIQSFLGPFNAWVMGHQYVVIAARGCASPGEATGTVVKELTGLLGDARQLAWRRMPEVRCAPETALWDSSIRVAIW